MEETVNVAGLTSKETTEAITSYLESKDLTRLETLKVYVGSEGLEFDTTYVEVLTTAAIKGYR